MGSLFAQCLLLGVGVSRPSMGGLGVIIRRSRFQNNKSQTNKKAMTQSTINNHDTYLTQLLTTLQTTTPAPSWLQTLHNQATGFLQEETIPNKKDEEWRFTNLDELLTHQFITPSGQQTPIDINSFQLPEAKQRLVFINGIYSSEFSQIFDTAGLFIGNLAGAIDHHLPIETYLGKQPGGEEVFTALNTTGLQDVAIIWAEANSMTIDPIHLLFIATGDQPLAIQPRVLVVAGLSSQLTIVEEYRHASQPNACQLINAVTEVFVAKNAQVNHVHIQDEDRQAFHIAKTAVSQAQDSQYHGYSISLGSQLSRHNWEIFQGGKQTSTTLNGLAMIGDTQVADTHSKIMLNYPHGQTNQLHKCIVNGKAHGIFNGKVLVPQAAQQTNANQLSRTLLLSPQARIDTKPQLEITADDVKCSHGATISQLSDDEMFYLQSRGLDPATSRTLLINAFAIEVINSVPVASVRDRLKSAVKNFQL
jgi:Fe-S cluster assembly protein SufD